ncbi:hypothetical protein C1A40_15295 [Tamlana carrageenivorans]|uniref:Uncharacterized protein n=1 Tax=Pseudotamlana carrageenivorans TaxID=2069432 RepID=A0A2I7SLD0_9FLAO|nr:hypothetical protein C1A40_15295 [Tamlana carrageenivorans]
MTKLIDILPDDYRDKLPASVFFIEKKNVITQINELHYAKSKLYNTDKMRCYLYYKSAFL